VTHASLTNLPSPNHAESATRKPTTPRGTFVLTSALRPSSFWTPCGKHQTAFPNAQKSSRFRCPSSVCDRTYSPGRLPKPWTARVSFRENARVGWVGLRSQDTLQWPGTPNREPPPIFSDSAVIQINFWWHRLGGGAGSLALTFTPKFLPIGITGNFANSGSQNSYFLSLLHTCEEKQAPRHKSEQEFAGMYQGIGFGYQRCATKPCRSKNS